MVRLLPWPALCPTHRVELLLVLCQGNDALPSSYLRQGEVMFSSALVS